MKCLQKTFKIRLDIHPMGEGGYAFYSKNVKAHNGIWGQIWTGKKAFDWSFRIFKKVPVVHSIFINFPEDGKLDPGNSYILHAKISSYEDITKNFNRGAKFEIRIGQLYDNKYWATGEILEILDDK